MLDNLIGPERPLSWVLQFWPVPVFSFISALVATLLCKNIALKLGIVDKPDKLVKTHKNSVAYLGGVGILAGLTVGILTGIYCISDRTSASSFEPDHFRLSFTWLAAVLAGGSIACLIGLIDDIFDIKPGQKILGQVAAAVVLIFVGIRPALYSSLEGARIPENIEVILGIPIVIIFVLGASNSLNLLDGLDGLCAGVTVIITGAMLLLAIHLGTWGFSEVGGDAVRVVICLGLLGAVFGFLPFNRHPAKIFMGDAGSMLLGFVVAVLMILFAEKTPRWWMASVVVFGLPILDTAVALVRRFINKRPLFVSDRGHIYDQMIDRGIPLKKTVAICYALAALYALIGLAMSQIKTRYALIVYVIVFVVSGIAVWKKGYLKMDGLRGAIRKDQ
ncbi:MAG: undecaprenyl/decaprenyl-phosphate alpha-N-acetylglucosaminyl 1-phosphate transferase [Planctomycetes bacterium]|nr:undecaprenyl/decaprenyl-phosphate alpha-N-acetylglucosaminyl 1-phosphate transferase [Planctomycetota bacterium]MBL7144486.1 undecaprenyl/decaprenyl-phosphate alpha-N-acetylglucosaminyl 1-phosphate transferase [Phycisphaerae bacterium]